MIDRIKINFSLAHTFCFKTKSKEGLKIVNVRSSKPKDSQSSKYPQKNLVTDESDIWTHLGLCFDSFSVLNVLFML